MIGLLDAAKHYSATKGANFETYAGIRIRGAMPEEVRRSVIEECDAAIVGLAN